MTLDDEDVPLTDSIERELRGRADPRHKVCWNFSHKKIIPDCYSKKTYELRERGDVVYASSSQEDILHMNRVGDLSVDKAWRTVRRPSDMVCPPYSILLQ